LQNIGKKEKEKASGGGSESNQAANFIHPTVFIAAKRYRIAQETSRVKMNGAEGAPPLMFPAQPCFQ